MRNSVSMNVPWRPSRRRITGPMAGGVILWLKHRGSAGVEPSLYLALLGIIVAAQLFRKGGCRELTGRIG